MVSNTQWFCKSSNSRKEEQSRTATTNVPFGDRLPKLGQSVKNRCGEALARICGQWRAKHDAHRGASSVRPSEAAAAMPPRSTSAVREGPVPRKVPRQRATSEQGDARAEGPHC